MSPPSKTVAWWFVVLFFTQGAFWGGFFLGQPHPAPNPFGILLLIPVLSGMGMLLTLSITITDVVSGKP